MKDEYGNENFFHSNYVFMMDKMNCRPRDIDEGKREIQGYELAPGYTTLYHCFRNDYQPSKKTVNKLVNLFNANLRPAIDVNTFLNVDLRKREIYRKDVAIMDEKYLGDYYCYYLSDNFMDEIHFCVLRIYKKNETFRAHMILSLRTVDQTREAITKVLDKGEGVDDITRHFNTWRSKQENQFQQCYYCEGRVQIFKRSVIIELINQNAAEHITYITLNTIPNIPERRYMGGLGIYMSPSVDTLETRVCKLAVQRKEGHNFPLRLDLLLPRLKMDVTDHHRYELTALENRNYQNSFL
jgi:hypothetical protein